MSKSFFYTLDENKNPVPCSAYEFEYDYQHFEQCKRVARTYIGPYIVSTVFLGMDHSFGGEIPILFETMICSEKKHEFTDYQWRYHTWQEAEEGHQAVVKLVKEGKLLKYGSDTGD